MAGVGEKLVYSLPEKLQGKKAHTTPDASAPTAGQHEEGDKRWKEEEWQGAGPDAREPDSGVPGTSSPRGHPSETVEKREGWRD